MSKGTASMGKKSGKKTHVYCRRCGKHTFHKRKKRCAACGYGVTAKKRYHISHKKGKP